MTAWPHGSASAGRTDDREQHDLMAKITKGIESQHRLIAHLVPPAVLAAIGQDELLDRLAHAKALVAKGQSARDPIGRGGCLSFDGAMLRLYHNGVLEGQIAAPGVAVSGEVAVGYNSVTNNSFYCGCLDELRLCARALPPAEFGPHNPLKQPQPDATRP